MTWATRKRSVAAILPLIAAVAAGCGEDQSRSNSGQETTGGGATTASETQVASAEPSVLPPATTLHGSSSNEPGADLATSSEVPVSPAQTSEPPSEASVSADSTRDWPPLESAASSDTASSAGISTSSEEPATEGETSANVCSEVVAAELFVDGIPAYAQCPASESAGIWSSDGISTSTEQPGDWRRTQWGGGYQCTEFASRYLYFVWGVDAVPNGNAGSWCDNEPPEGLVQALTPVHGDLIVFAPGSCGASAETGHVAVVDVVDNDASRVEIVEQNRAGRRRTNFDCAACFLHAVANDAQGLP